MSFPVVKDPVLSPSLNEFGEAILVDENSNALELVALAAIDANGHSNLGSEVIAKSHFSQVTGRQQSAVALTPSNGKIRVLGVVGLDSSGNPVPFVAASASTASKVSGKFQSTVTVATGSSQSIAHGLGVVPSLVLVAAYDNTAAGSTPFAFAIVEGTHTTTNIVVTATAGLKFKVIAFV